jgi:hypothetical protein
LFFGGASSFYFRVSSKVMIWELEQVTVLFSEKDIVVLAGVEGRVEVDEVDRFVLDVLAQDF